MMDHSFRKGILMRAINALVTLILAVGLGGCGEKSVARPRQQSHPAVAEAQAHFTYKGKPIPPFFLTDFHGGPEAGNFWTRETGCRISSVVVAGLFVGGDGTYANSEIFDGRDDGGFISFCILSDEDRGPVGSGLFGYRFVGTTPSGITVLEHIGNTGGSGTIPGVLFVRFEMESVGVTKDKKQDRLIMRFLGEQSWGDRVYRDVKLDGNSLWLGPTRTIIPAHKDLAEDERTILLE